MSMDEQRARLIEALGILPFYYDIHGVRHEASPEAIDALLQTLGVTDSTLDDLARRPWNEFIAPAMCVSVNSQPSNIPLHIQLDEGSARIHCTISDEKGRIEHLTIDEAWPDADAVIDGQRHVRVLLPNLTDRAMGYYWVTVECRSHRRTYHGRMRLIIGPDQCHLPASPTSGITTSLYALRSDSDWGVGDMGSLSEMLRMVRDTMGGGFVGINPLHATTNTLPYGISPYASVSRLYRNAIYIDVQRVMKLCKVRLPRGYKARIKSLREAQFVQYEEVFSLKMSVLRTCYVRFLRRKPEQDFADYVEAEGHELDMYATFSAITDIVRRGHPDIYSWRQWPAELHTPEGLREFKRRHKVRIGFYKFLQWQLDRQLRDAVPPDMPIGIYNDLAVGSSADGSDAWAYQDVFASGISAGAPPDDFNMNGQSWGFPPLLPAKLRESGYELFIQTIRRNLAHAGALRIDHAIGLFRIYCVPDGMSPKAGVYLTYPSEDLLRIIALESVRAKAVIIAEDLGTISDDIRDALKRYGMLSYRLFYFERDWERGTFLPPEKYPELALAAVTTHDLPTLAGYWSGHDINVKHALGIYHDEEARQHDIADRARVRQAMLDSVSHRLPEALSRDATAMPEMSSELCHAIYGHLSDSPSLMVSVSIEDVLGLIEQQNMPGTVDEHPNWQRRLPLEISKIAAHVSELKCVLKGRQLPL